MILKSYKYIVLTLFLISLIIILNIATLSKFNSNNLDKIQLNFVHDPNCKFVDLVYTWVNGSEPSHILKRKYYEKLYNDDNNDNNNNNNNNNNKTINRNENEKEKESDENRYRDYGSLKYSLRSVKKNAPWIRNIYIITDNQIPVWFNISNSENVKFIFHDQFFKNKSDLPVFNSNSIESNFYNLPIEVSNCFLYSNDDIFFGEKVEISDFYDNEFNQYLFENKEDVISSFTQLGDGYTTSFNTPNNNNKQLRQYDIWTKSLVKTNRVLDRVFNIISQRVNSQHGIQVFNRQIWNIMEMEILKELKNTSSNKFRTENDIQIPFAYNQFAKRYSKFKIGEPNNKYYALTNKNYRSVLDQILNNHNTSIKTVCLNDLLTNTITPSRNENGDYYIYEDLSAIISQIIEFYEFLFPIPSNFENKN